MKKLILSLIVSGSLLLSAKAQTDTNLPPGFGDVFGFLRDASTNLMVIPYGTLWQSSTGNKFGGGIALAYHLSDYVVPSLRIDILDGTVTMPSGNCQIQYKIAIGQHFVLTPFAIAGIATPVMGRATQNGTAVGIFGAGAALDIYGKFSVIADYEKWTGYSGNQIRLGFKFDKIPFL